MDNDLTIVCITLSLNVKTKNVKKSSFMPLIFADYGRRFNIGKIVFLGRYVHSDARLLKINRLSLSHLDLSKSKF